jgi:hypothetical protein
MAGISVTGANVRGYGDGCKHCSNTGRRTIRGERAR